jgi:hypothetical protein
MLFISCSRLWPLRSATAVALFLAGPASAKATFWSLPDPGFQSQRTTSSDLADFPQQGWNFSTSQAFSNYGGVPWARLKLDNQDMTLTGSGDTILNLRSLVLNGGTLTLEGTAGTAFVINVRKKFSLDNGASIVLSGGLQATDIVFNVLGHGRPVTIDAWSSVIGTINASQRGVQITDQSSVIGAVNAKRVILASGGSIIPPPVVSP